MIEPTYKVVWPLGGLRGETLPLAPRLSELRGKTICELSDEGFRAEEVFPLLRELLNTRYGGMRFVDYSAFGGTHGPKEDEVIAALPELLRAHRCDAVISGVGG